MRSGVVLDACAANRENFVRRVPTSSALPIVAWINQLVKESNGKPTADGSEASILLKDDGVILVQVGSDRPSIAMSVVNHPRA